MKKIPIKRLMFSDGNGISHIGAYEYDGRLTDDNILGAFHEIGQTIWIGNSLWTIRRGVPVYRVTVETFYQYEKRWFELLFDMIRRI